MFFSFNFPSVRINRTHSIYVTTTTTTRKGSSGYLKEREICIMVLFNACIFCFHENCLKSIVVKKIVVLRTQGRVNNGNGADYLCDVIPSQLHSRRRCNCISLALMRARSVSGWVRVNRVRRIGINTTAIPSNCTVFTVKPVSSSSTSVYSQTLICIYDKRAHARSQSTTLLSLSLLICGRLVAGECATPKRPLLRLSIANHAAKFNSYVFGQRVYLIASTMRGI